MIGDWPRNCDSRNVLPFNSLAVKSGALLPAAGAASRREANTTAAASGGSARNMGRTADPPLMKQSDVAFYQSGRSFVTRAGQVVAGRLEGRQERASA